MQLAAQLLDAISLYIEQQHHELFAAVTSGNVQRPPCGLRDDASHARQAMIALIESYIDVVLTLDEATVDGLRRSGSQFVEVRSYNLKPGSGGEFQRLFLEEAFALLRRWNVDVVAYGPSRHDETAYSLIRRFDSLSHRQESEDSFYGSDAWRNGPREQILALIESYTEIVLALKEATVDGLRRGGSSGN